MNFSVDLGLGQIIPELKGIYDKYKENKIYNKESYNDLLNKYAESIEIIEKLRDEIERIKNDELDMEKLSMLSAGLKLMGIDKINKEGLEELNNIYKYVKERKEDN